MRWGWRAGGGQEFFGREEEFVDAFESGTRRVGLWTTRYYPVQAVFDVVFGFIYSTHVRRQLTIFSRDSWQDIQKTPSRSYSYSPQNSPESSKNFVRAARATPMLVSVPVSHAMQTRRVFSRWSKIKGMACGRTECRKWCWPFLPWGVWIYRTRGWSLKAGGA
jgi:hypothetical protein